MFCKITIIHSFMQHPINYYSVLYFHNQIQYRTILFFLQNLIEYLTAFRMSSYSFILYTLCVRSFFIISSSMKGRISFSNLLIFCVFYGSCSFNIILSPSLLRLISIDNLSAISSLIISLHKFLIIE